MRLIKPKIINLTLLRLVIYGQTTQDDNLSLHL